MNRFQIIGYVSAALSSILFGAVPAMAKPITSNVDVLALSSLVYLIAGLTFTPIAKRSTNKFQKKDYGLLAAMSICGTAIAPYLYFTGLSKTSASNAALLINTEMIFTVFLAILFFKEKLRLTGFIAIVLVLVGVIIITTNFEFSNSLLHPNAGHFLILGATLAWAVDNNLSKILSRKVETTKIVQLQCIIGGTILLGIAFLFHAKLEIVPYQIPYIILIGALGVGGSLYFFLQGIKRIGTIRTITIYSMSPIFGIIFAFVFLHEQISIYQIIAILIMLTGVYLINNHGGSIEKQVHLKG